MENRWWFHLIRFENSRFFKVTRYQVNFRNDDFVHHLVLFLERWIWWNYGFSQQMQLIQKNDTFAKIHSTKFEQLHYQNWQCETLPAWCRYLCLICVAVGIPSVALDGQTWYPQSRHCFGIRNGDGLPVQLRYVDFCAKNKIHNWLPSYFWEGSYVKGDPSEHWMRWNRTWHI